MQKQEGEGKPGKEQEWHVAEYNYYHMVEVVENEV